MEELQAMEAVLAYVREQWAGPDAQPSRIGFEAHKTDQGFEVTYYYQFGGRSQQHSVKYSVHGEPENLIVALATDER